VIRSPKPSAVRGLWLTALLCAGALSGCTSSMDPPEIRSVLPGTGYNGTETTINILGVNFYPTVSIDASERSEASFDAQFEVALESDAGTFALTGVDLVDYSTLVADVPEGFEIGEYDVVVTSPSGLQGVGAGMFLVTDTRAEKLLFSAEEVNEEGHVEVPVGEWKQLLFRLYDDNGSPVSEGLDVQVIADPPEGVELSIEDRGDLRNVLIDGYTVTGRLQSDGTGAIWVNAASESVISYTVLSVDSDSWIDSDEIDHEYLSTDLYEIQIELPEEDYVATAGEPFEVTLTALDEFGDQLDQAFSLSLDESCRSSLVGETEIFGSGVVEVIVTGATLSDCKYSELVAYLVRPAIVGTSPGFTTVAAALDEFEVQVRPQDATETEIVAGVTQLTLEIEPRDAYRNVVFGYEGAFHLSDGLGSLELDATPGDGTCGMQSPSSGRIFCNLLLTVSDEDVVITVTDLADSTAGGESPAFEVLPDAPVTLDVVIAVSETQADDAYNLVVTAYDAWGNEADIELSSSYFLSVSDEVGGTSCEEPTQRSQGSYRLSCSSRVSGDRTITTRLTPVDTSADTLVEREPLTVINGALDELILLTTPAAVAGEPFALDVQGFDAWGNAYVEQHSGADIVLEDSSGTLSPTSLSLDASGEGYADVVITASNPAAVIRGIQDSVTLGAVTLTVTAAELDHLTVEPSAGWVWLSNALAVTISARDAYENLVDDYSELVTLSSQQGAFTERMVQVSDGESTVAVSWSDAVLQDIVSADGVVFGASMPVDVLDAGCADGPTASLDLDGGDEAVSCLVAGEALVSADIDAVAGDADLEALHLGPVDGGQARLSALGLPASRELSLGATGAYTVELIVADEAACGARATALWWVAEDDDGPAGPVTLTTPDSTLIVGDPGAVVTVAAAAWTCSGDVAAAGTELLVRSDRGEVQSATSTGAGLSITLNVRGEGTFNVSAVDTLSGGDARVVAGRADGSAYGEITLDYTGDNALPYVVDVWPSGVTEGPLETLSVTLSEPLNPVLNLTDGDEVYLDGPAGPVALDTLEHDGNVVTVGLDNLDPSDGVYTLTLTGGTLGASLLDRAGNRLDGVYSGSPSDYTVRFGATGDAGIAISECGPTPSSFFPDGDDGVDKEADRVAIGVKATSTPAWWQLEVLDASGALARFHREPALTDAASLVWDGRGDDGALLEAGTWTLHVRSVDTDDNLSDACETQVELGQHISGPE